MSARPPADEDIDGVIMTPGARRLQNAQPPPEPERPAGKPTQKPQKPAPKPSPPKPKPPAKSDEQKNDPSKPKPPARTAEQKKEPPKPKPPAKTEEQKKEPPKPKPPAKSDEQKKDPSKAKPPAKTEEQKKNPSKPKPPAKTEEQKKDSSKPKPPAKTAEQKKEPPKPKPPAKSHEQKKDPSKATAPAQTSEQKKDTSKPKPPTKTEAPKKEPPKPKPPAKTEAPKNEPPKPKPPTKSEAPKKEPPKPKPPAKTEAPKKEPPKPEQSTTKVEQKQEPSTSKPPAQTEEEKKDEPTQQKETTVQQDSQPEQKLEKLPPKAEAATEHAAAKEKSEKKPTETPQTITKPPEKTDKTPPAEPTQNGADSPALQSPSKTTPTTDPKALASLPEEKEAEFISDRVGMMVHAIQADREKELLEGFGKCKTDEERFAYVWALPAVHEVIQLEPEYHGKSAEKAAEHREAGNRYFQKRSYLSALQSYNQSVIHAPSGDALLGLAYANRSAALLHLKRYRECLGDISLALESDYPTDSQYKLQDRRGKCQLALGKKQAAADSFRCARDLVTASKLDDRVLKAWTASLDKQLAECEAADGTDTVDPPQSALPDVSGNPQEKYPALSDTVSVQYSTNKGRYISATKDLKPGQILAVERPYASVLFQAQQSSYCYHCMVAVDRPVPCTECVSILYCSPECRETAWTVYHQYECKFHALFDTLLCARIGQLALRMVMTAGLPYLLEYHKNQKNAAMSGKQTSPEEEFKRQEVYRSDYSNIYRLETHSRDRFPVGFFNFTVAAAFLTKILVVSGFFQPTDAEDLSATENVTAIGSLVLRHLQILQCNGCRIQKLLPDCRFDNPQCRLLGVALYPTVSFVNHSCDPVADFNYTGSAVILRAVREIRSGDDVTVSYGPVFYDTELKVRRQMLLHCYFFSCECEACEQFWPTISRLADCTIRLRCQGCRAHLDLSRTPYKKVVACPSCQHEHNVKEMLGRLQQSHDTFGRGMTAAHAGRYQTALDHFTSHMAVLQTYVCQPWHDWASCQASIKHCYRSLEN